jgi:CDP-paratose 2-epimerase
MLILISGICGFVGSTLAKTIREQAPDWKVVGFDNLSRSGSFLNKEVLERLGIKVFHADLRQPDDLAVLPNPDWVIDAAASTSVLAGVDGHGSSRQLLDINLTGTVNLLELAKRSRAGFILLSTSRVYSIKDLLSLKLDVKDNAFTLAKTQNLPTGVTAIGVSEDFAQSLLRSF